jgi:hypothetical protein
MRQKNVIRHPAAWKSNFQSATLRTSFCLSLTQPMLELFCAIADGVWWDRTGSSVLARPDSFMASSEALTKRGLIVSHAQRQEPRTREECERGERGELVRIFELTPAGEALVNLLRVAGMFVEADHAIERRLK